LPPLIAIAKGGAALPTMTIAPVLKAAATSLLVAAPSALLSVAAAIALARARIAAGRRGSLFAQTPLLALAMPPLALASGFYALARQIGDPSLIAWPALIFANALTALPFVYRLIEPPLLIAEARFGRLARSLGVSGLARLRFIEGPLLRAPVGAALALAGAFSLGDLGVVALFGGDSLMTLPLLLYERLGAYRMAEADAIAACLAALVLALFIVSRRLGGRDARAS
ncbi:MAG: thiamine/thiamine pyrophosphate ABC transporter permease ThiP, partial [Labrys sp. (in: a-proteobacteria)]